jgi:4,5-DOPA dioxygenase extradiol
MPAFFFGHGSPMNAVEDNDFSRAWSVAAADIPKPRAILCVSAHWLTEGTLVGAAEKPSTIHDFGGFPRELYQIRYPAPGAPAEAAETAEHLKPTPVRLDQERGLDHGAWSVLRRVYPDADVPVFQLSIDYGRPAAHHYELGSRLKKLRSEGILVAGSGNVVHNLGMIAWDRMGEDDFAYGWAREFDAAVRQAVERKRDDDLIDWSRLGAGAARLAVPAPDHYFPLLYVLGARDGGEPVLTFNQKAVGGSLTMTSYRFG